MGVVPLGNQKGLMISYGAGGKGKLPFQLRKLADPAYQVEPFSGVGAFQFSLGNLGVFVFPTGVVGDFIQEVYYNSVPVPRFGSLGNPLLRKQGYPYGPACFSGNR